MGTSRTILKCTGIGLLVIIVGIASSVVTNYMTDYARTVSEKKTSSENLEIADAYLNFGNTTPVSTIYRDRPFFVHYKTIGSELCNAEFNTSMTSLSGTAAVMLRNSNSWYPKSIRETNELFEVPAGLPVGSYRIIKKAVIHCNSIISYSTIFNIEANVADSPKANEAPQKAVVAPRPSSQPHREFAKPVERESWWHRLLPTSDTGNSR